MAPKAARAEKEKIATDKTFGMKNKNKSKVVQKYIKQITCGLTGVSGKEDQANRKAKDDKESALKKNALMASLFNQQTDKKGKAYDPIVKKAAKKAEEDAIAAGKKIKEEERKALIEGIANAIRLTNAKGVRMSELGGHPIINALKTKYADTFKILSLLLFIKAQDKVFWVDDPDSTNPMLRCQDDVDLEVAPDERSLEEILEERRAALPPGGTPVTESTFLAWKIKKEAERMAKVEEDRKEASKKKGGTGFSGLSGKDLFQYDASLFAVDDDDAVSAGEYDERAEDPDYSGDEDAAAQPAAQPKKKEKDVETDDEEEMDFDALEAAGPSSSTAAAVPINKDLFLGEGGDDLPDDLDDLSDD